jgi:hypothetical protein
MANDLNVDRAGRTKVALAAGAVASLVAAVWWPTGLVLAAASAVAILSLDAALLRFLAAQRGTLFALRAVPWQLLYHLYSGLAFGVTVVRHVTHRTHSATLPLVVQRLRATRQQDTDVL